MLKILVEFENPKFSLKTNLLKGMEQWRIIQLAGPGVLLEIFSCVNIEEDLGRRFLSLWKDQVLLNTLKHINTQTHTQT